MQTTVFIDGASRNHGMPGRSRAACAVVIFQDREEVVRFVRGLGDRTNEEAEYEALIDALLICSMSDMRQPVIYSDSSVVVGLTKNKMVCRDRKLLPYYMTVKELSMTIGFHIKQVPRTKSSYQTVYVISS